MQIENFAGDTFPKQQRWKLNLRENNKKMWKVLERVLVGHFKHMT